jgi:cytochrome P450
MCLTRLYWLLLAVLSRLSGCGSIPALRWSSGSTPWGSGTASSMSWPTTGSRPTMCAVAHKLLDTCAAAGACEFMAAFADPYPARVIATLLGIPQERFPQFEGWATDLGLLFGYTVARDLARIEAALEGLAACVDDLLAARRAAPGPDLLSALIAAEEAGDRLSDAELRALVTGLVFAGQDTTRNQLGCALTLFLEHPAQWARLAADPTLAALAVEEVMRVRPTVPSIWRVAADDFAFQGLRIPAGTFLSLFVATANTDPRVFGEGGFDIARERPAQLTFGGGVHACLGAALARTELEEALPLLAARLRDLEAAGDVCWRPAMGIRGPAAPLPPSECLTTIHCRDTLMSIGPVGWGTPSTPFLAHGRRGGEGADV